VITLVRVDNRLIHGQVVEAWLPHLKVARVAVADDEAAYNPLIRAAMALAVQPSVEVVIQPLREFNFERITRDDVRTLVLVRDVKDALQAKEQGLKLSRLNLGNVHFATGRRQVSASVFLSQEELDQLKLLAQEGVAVDARGVPSEKPVSFAEMAERFARGS
jgi:PTS system mannose-specific IIB component